MKVFDILSSQSFFVLNLMSKAISLVYIITTLDKRKPVIETGLITS